LSFLVLNASKCKRDGICISECPYGVINDADGSGFPAIRKGEEKHCIFCGHCVSVCPHGALSLSKMSQEECLEVRDELTISFEEAKQFLKSRRSVRSFKDKRVPRETLIHLIDISRWAPSAMNKQSVHWLIIERRSEIRQLAKMVMSWMQENNYQAKLIAGLDQGKDMVLRDAPHLAVAHAPKDDFWSTTDCVISLTYMELAAIASGLGACWAGLFTRVANIYPPLIKALDLPDNHKVCGALMLGYARNKFRLIPRRKEAKIKWLCNLS
jgi:nitroreductase/NAD-dependent dihydropyrimidine dehydrogenase PreA subunit